MFVYYVVEFVKSMMYFEFEDIDIMRLFLQYDGDKNI